jgi:DNA-binding response OmpR family regulator
VVVGGVVCEFLRLAGRRVREVSAFGDLLDCSLERALDAVFIGTDSVDTKAVEIVRHVRRIHAHVPIVFACCQEDEAVRITWPDVSNAFLAKPFELKNMVDLVQECEVVPTFNTDRIVSATVMSGFEKHPSLCSYLA